MSGTVKVTVFYDNKNKIECSKAMELFHDINMTLMSTLLKNVPMTGEFCGGRGVCGRCRLLFTEGAPAPTALDRKFFTPEKLREGWRLACAAKPKSDCCIRVDFLNTGEIDIVTAVAAVGEKSGYSQNFDQYGQLNQPSLPSQLSQPSQPSLPSQLSQPNRPRQSSQPGQPGQSSHAAASFESQYIIATDLGTTTIAMQLMDMESGEVIDTYCAMNPQRRYGADVLSRIKAAEEGCAGEMKDSVWEVIGAGVERFGELNMHGKTVNICCMCIAGNTVMTHILMGLSAKGLGKSPFTPEELGLQQCRAPGHDFPVYIAPGISAFVGGDIAAGLYHCGLPGISHLEKDGEKINEDAVLFIDLGTNGEMAIADRNGVIATAAAAGPAFEGGVGARIIGSDMVKITALLLRRGIIDETGLLADEYFDEGVWVALPAAGSMSGVQTAHDPGSAGDVSAADGPYRMQALYETYGYDPHMDMTLHITQADIRSLQMAKAAVRAGIEILCSRADNSKVGRVFLAGGFGYYLDTDDAVDIGLLPEKFRDCTVSVGNTSLAGAFDIGRGLWQGRIDASALSQRLSKVKVINLAGEKDFEKKYIGSMNFP